jgi:AcrR family transcriptional regulator
MSAAPAAPRPARKRPGRYHHGSLREALIQAAVRVIERDGIDALTLRSVSSMLGVSQTAMYRHFADKDSLLAAVGAEGFRTLRAALVEAWEGGGRTLEAFAAMGRAYVTFGLRHPAHSRVMFGGALGRVFKSEELRTQGDAAFLALLDPLVDLQRRGLIRRDEPMTQAAWVWAAVHGITMLLTAGNLGPGVDTDALSAYVQERIVDSLTPVNRA